MPSEQFQSGLPPPRATGLSSDDLITLNEEIAGMARAGLPLDPGLAALAREMGRGKLQTVTAALANDLRAGKTLPEALASQGRRVPPFYAGLVAAGVRSGRITEVLATLTLYTRTLSDLRASVISAFVYPTAVVLVAIILFGFASYVIMPQFQKIFSDFKMKLPWLTEQVLFLGEYAIFIFVLPPLALVIIFFVVRALMRRTPTGQRLWARWMYALPIFGTLLRSARLAAFTDLLGILVDYGVPLPEAFRLASEASSDPIMASAAGRVEVALSHGTLLGEALRRERAVPEVIAWMVGYGADRGTLGPTLHRVAEMYRRQAELRAALLRSALPPILVIVTASVVIGLFIVTLLLPLLGLMEGLSGGNHK